MTHDQREIHRKKRILEYAERVGNINKTCRYFGVARSTFYLWRDRYRELGEEGLRSRRCGPHNHPNKTPDEVVEKILHLRRTYHMGPIRIVWYLGSLPRHQDLRRDRLSGLQAAWPQPTSEPRGTACRPYASLREAGSRPPRAGRREVPDIEAEEGRVGATLSVHGHRRRHTSSRTQDLPPPHPSQRHRLHQLRGGQVPVSDTNDSNRSRSRVPGAVPLARGGPGHGTRLHQTADASAQRQSRAVTPNR